MLYIFSPFLNKILDNQTTYERLYFLLVLFVIAVYIGIIGRDPSVCDGKNLVNFMLLYTIGDSIKRYDLGRFFPAQKWLVIWLIFMITDLAICYFTTGTVIGKGLRKLSFPYNSPLLIISSTLFFLIFTRINFSSKIVNTLATSVFAVYLIHENELVHNYLYPFVWSFWQDNFLSILIFAFIALIVVGLCILIDKILQPIQVKIAQLFSFIFEKISLIFAKI